MDPDIQSESETPHSVAH